MSQSNLNLSAKAAGPVECLGQKFLSEEARREHFLELLAQKLKDPEFRKIEGFPIGKDEDILALSDPPYYTACPNPWLADFAKGYGTPYDSKQLYHREPFTADVSEGKTHVIYNAHSYHTKVPHRAIMRYLLHYTQPGDVVFDGFCGTGMTGVAAYLCGSRAEVQELGYRIKDDGTILNEEGKAFSKLGARRTILNDLSPVASFIAHNYNTSVDVNSFEAKAKQVLDEVESELGWMYKTLVGANPLEIQKAVQALRKCKTVDECRELLNSADHLKVAIDMPDAKFSLGTIDYVVWSDVFSCPECGNDVVFWEVAVDKQDGTVEKDFNCPSCSAKLTKRAVDRAITKIFDPSLSQTIGQAKQVPVLVSYSVGRSGREKPIEEFDKALIEVIQNLPLQDWIPALRMPAGDEGRRNDDSGLTHVHHFYTARNLRLLSRLKSKCVGNLQLLLLFNSQLVNISRLNRYRPGVSFPYNPLSGTLYVGSQICESNIFDAYRNKMKKLASAFGFTGGDTFVSTGSSVSVALPDGCVDYIFTDPPFGGNLTYGALSSLWEGWLGVMTDIQKEAITNNKLGKGLPEYHSLMGQCFKEFFRILKPGRWMTVEFSNTQASVWNSIQSTLQEAGAVVANVSALDKQMGSFKAVTTTTAVKQDLIISAYKPNGGLEDRFAKRGETEEGVWDFIRTHLKNLPVVKAKGGEMETIVERDPRILYDRMVAFYVGHSTPVPLNSAEFQASLTDKFPERDGMIFLPEQVNEYDKKRAQVENIGQLSIFVEDERSAINWLRNFLKNRPSTSQDIHPEFMQQLGASWKKWEARPEMSALLDQNFLCYDGTGEVPSQIHAYLSTQFKELRNLPKEHPQLKAKAKNRWYVPDPKKNVDVETLRNNQLLKEFWSYLPEGYTPPSLTANKGQTLPGLTVPRPKIPKGKKLKELRTEAVRVGFKYCYQNKDYTTILVVAEMIPDSVLNEDEQLQMIYDTAVTRSGSGE
jgi:DNA modification methylase